MDYNAEPVCIDILINNHSWDDVVEEINNTIFAIGFEEFSDIDLNKELKVKLNTHERYKDFILEEFKARAFLSKRIKY